MSLLRGSKLTFAQKVDWWICHGKGGQRAAPPITNISCLSISPLRDGMIKRPGHESYLGKIVAEERKAYSQVLEIGQSLSQTESEAELSQSD